MFMSRKWDVLCCVQFLASQVEAFDAVAGNDQNMVYNIQEVYLPYSDASENLGTIIEGIHLELLVDLPEHPNAEMLGDPWKVRFQDLMSCLWTVELS
jgi:hypothetical protein